VAKFLSNLETAQIHTQPKNVKVSRSIVNTMVGAAWAVDLTWLKSVTADQSHVTTVERDSQVVLTCIDQFGWAVIIKNKTGAPVAQAFGDILAEGKEEMGRAPSTVRSDNGSEFISKQFQAVLAENGVKHILSETYAPTQNAIIERFNRTIKTMVYRYLIHWGLMRSLRGPMIRQQTHGATYGPGPRSSSAWVIMCG